MTRGSIVPGQLRRPNVNSSMQACLFLVVGFTCDNRWCYMWTVGGHGTSMHTVGWWWVKRYTEVIP